MNQIYPSAQITTSICNSTLRACLGNRGYTVSDNGIFWEAKKADKEYEYTLKILPVSRFFQDWDTLEEVRISVSFAGIKKLLKESGIKSFSTLLETENVKILNKASKAASKAQQEDSQQELKKKVLFCVGFGLCRGSYQEIETTLVDLRAFFPPQRSDDTFCIDRKSHFFHYTRSKNRLDDSDGVIVRTLFREYKQEEGRPQLTAEKPEHFLASIKSTTAICTGVLQASLRQHGYDIIQNGSFLEASNNEHAIAILPVSRCLSGKNVLETTPVSASFAGVRKLLYHYGVQRPQDVLQQRDTDDLDVIVSNANLPGHLCIAFCICKYSYSDVEIMVVPVKTIVQQAAFGNVFSIGIVTHDLFYDYAKANANNMKLAVLQDHYIEIEITPESPGND